MENNQQDLSQVVLENSRTQNPEEFRSDFVRNYHGTQANYGAKDEQEIVDELKTVQKAYTNLEEKMKTHEEEMKSLGTQSMSGLGRVAFNVLDKLGLYSKERLTSRAIRQLDKHLEYLAEAKELYATASSESRESLSASVSKKDKSSYFADKYTEVIQKAQKKLDDLKHDASILKGKVEKGDAKEGEKYRETLRYIESINREVNDTRRKREMAAVEYIKQSGISSVARWNELEKETMLNFISAEYNRLQIVRARLQIETSKGNKKTSLTKIIHQLGAAEKAIEPATKMADAKDKIMMETISDLRKSGLDKLPVGKTLGGLEGVNYEMQCDAFKEMQNLRATDEANLL